MNCEEKEWVAKGNKRMNCNHTYVDSSAFIFGAMYSTKSVNQSRAEFK